MTECRACQRAVRNDLEVDVFRHPPRKRGVRAVAAVRITGRQFLDSNEGRR
jgi:hypothetical protein